MLNDERRFGPSAARALLRDPQVLRLWSAGALIQCARWLDILAFAILVLAWTGSAFAVTAILFTRMLPLLFFGSIAGTLADRVDRRRLLVAMLTLVCAAYGAGAWWSVDGKAHLVLAFLLSIVAGLFWSVELPVRRGLLAETAGMDRVGVSMGLELLTANATRMVGPAIGGALVALLGFSGVLLAGLLLHGLALVAVAGLGDKPPTKTEPTGRVQIAAPLRQGWRHVRATPVLIGTVAVTAAINLWGFPYVSLVPVIAKEVMGLGPVGTGLLVATEGLGAFMASIAITMAARPAGFRRIYSFGTILFLAAVMLFGLSSAVPTAALFLVLAGMGMAGFNTMQTVLMLQGADPPMRGRSLGILVGAMGLAPFGFLQFGLAASWLGASAAVVLVAAIGGLAVLGCLFAWPTLLQSGPVAPAPVGLTLTTAYRAGPPRASR